MRKLRLSPVAVAATWRIVQAAAVSVVLASALLAADQPLGDPCRFCESGQLSWVWCALAGCW